jgi:hypothetical protein
MDSTTPKPFVFVLMPFNDEFKDVYELGIKEACKEAGAYCERVDEQIYEGYIIERIYNQISKADIIISDMSGRNPNVFYETGYAHALGKKRVILLTQKGEDIPFDLKHYPHLIYPTITVLKQELVKKMLWCIDNPEENISKIGFNLQFFIMGKNLESNPTIECQIFEDEFDYESSSYVANIQLDICNPNNQLFSSNFNIGLKTPNEFDSSNGKIITLPDGNFIHFNKEEFRNRIYPKAGILLGGTYI